MNYTPQITKAILRSSNTVLSVKEEQIKEMQAMEENRSEVARLMRRIDEEYEAAQRGLSGYAQVSQHEYITARMERIGEHYGDLEQLVGEEEACRLLVEAFNKLYGGKR